MQGYAAAVRTLVMHAMVRFALIVVAVLLCLGQFAGATELRGKVVGVSDGDTITVLDASHATHRVRLNGIDAPEKGQLFAARAKERLAGLIFGRAVIVSWSKHDRYGRIVGQVHVAAAGACVTPGCPRSFDAGLALIEAGLAWHYKRYQNEQTVEDRAEYARAEQTARSGRAGLWRDAHPVAPWDYRSNRRVHTTGNDPTSRIN